MTVTRRIIPAPPLFGLSMSHRHHTRRAPLFVLSASARLPKPSNNGATKVVTGSRGVARRVS
jgi:hypothetical protein